MIKLFQNNLQKVILLITVILIVTALVTFLSTRKSTTINQDSNKSKTIIIYCSHPQEMYYNGNNVTDIAEEIFNKLKNEYINVCLLEVPTSTPRNNGFEISREMLKKKVENFNEVILLDIHIDYPVFQKNQKPLVKNSEQGINIVVSEKNKSFKENRKFADRLLNEIDNLDKKNTTKIILNNADIFNQDLSNNALLINIGTGNTSMEDVKTYVDKLVIALKKITVINYLTGSFNLC
ncbi:hypothetical protein Q428_05065 [Fervidicella metallireducens AeB]|uniref:Uncharacterized protein n=1 Tax=Fervidicella metallireducens AeB TaxID=1403537 RepID=A0A017RYP7_9CLOT|nr:stage II sporulation protein P [Fervidicella metallireducens]EYE89030.1 hypothetical protein Q428_05065 [Fervidicella metallireducens AeB]